MTVEVPDWVHMSETADGIPCNQYFVDNPDMVLGTMAWDERMKGKYGDDSRVTTCVADDSIPLSEQLKAAIAKSKAALKLSEPKKNSVMKPTLSLPTRRCEISHIPLLTENCIFVKTRL